MQDETDGDEQRQRDRNGRDRFPIHLLEQEEVESIPDRMGEPRDSFRNVAYRDQAAARGIVAVGMDRRAQLVERETHRHTGGGDRTIPGKTAEHV